VLVVIQEKYGYRKCRRCDQFPAHVAGDSERIEDFFYDHDAVEVG
jgi:hypothetical protein